MDSFHSLEVSPLINPSGFSVTRAGPGLGPPPLAVAAGTKIMGRNGLHAGHSSRSESSLASLPRLVLLPYHLPSAAVIRSHGADCRGQISMRLLLTWAPLRPTPERVKGTLKKIKIFFKRQTFDIVLYLNTVLNLLD